jgi:integrase/recombinase XerD
LKFSASTINESRDREQVKNVPYKTVEELRPLRRRMIEDMTVRNLSRSTQQSYLYAVAKFSRHFNRAPDQLGMEDVRAYQLHLVAQKRSWSHINQVACALRFFYGITLGHKEALERKIRANSVIRS